MAGTRLTLTLPTGRHLLGLSRRIRGEAGYAGDLEHTEVVEVAGGQLTRLAADLRGGVVVVESSPAGALVRVNGEEAGVTPWQRRDLPQGARLQVKLELPGHDPVERTLEITDYDEPVTWQPVLEPRVSTQLRVDFTTGPREVAVTATQKLDYQQQRYRPGATQPETTALASFQADFEAKVKMRDPDRRGGWTAVEAELAGGEPFVAGTQISYQRRPSGWAGRLVRGGYRTASEGRLNPALSPLYPGLWLDDEILPDMETVEGHTWSVPAHKAALLIPYLPAGDLTGTIEARVAGLGGERRSPWAWIVFNYNLQSQQVVMPPSWGGTTDAPAANQMGEGTRYMGTVAFRLMLAEAYVIEAMHKQVAAVVMLSLLISNSGAEAPAGNTGASNRRDNKPIRSFVIID
jgi:hypothetical protein